MVFLLHSTHLGVLNSICFYVKLVNSLYVLNQTTVSYLLNKTIKIAKRTNIFFYDGIKWVYLTFT